MTADTKRANAHGTPRHLSFSLPPPPKWGFGGGGVLAGVGGGGGGFGGFFGVGRSPYARLTPRNGEGSLGFFCRCYAWIGVCPVVSAYCRLSVI